MYFNCSCDMDVDDYATMLEKKVKKARKEHQCHECYSVIQKGELYLVEKEIYDGRFSTHKTCLPCREIRDAYMSSYYWGQIWEHLRDCLEDIPLPDYEKFSQEAKMKILEMM